MGQFSKVLLAIDKAHSTTEGLGLRPRLRKLIFCYVYFICKSINILYNTTQEYILYNIIPR